MVSSAPTKPSPYDIRAISRAKFDRAKRWWAAGLGLKLLIVLADIAIVFLDTRSWIVPLVILIIGILGELALFNFNRLYGKAESLLRKLDGRDLMGWAIEPEELRDLIAETPQNLRRIVNHAEEEYFASNLTVGPARTVEGMQESAWWSKHMCRTMAVICSVVVLILVGTSILVLLFALNTVQPSQLATVPDNTSKIVSATITLIFSLGLLNLVFGYYDFGSTAAKIEQEAARLLRAGINDSGQAIKLMNDYHLARASAPPIPSWLWRMRNKDMNALWDRYKSP